MHRLRDEAERRTLPPVRDTGKTCDLVVVGAGISGLVTAHAYRKARPGASVPTLDDHDDFRRAGSEAPCEIARWPFGRVSIANSDAGACADSAIDHGLRVAREALTRH